MKTHQTHTPPLDEATEYRQADEPRPDGRRRRLRSLNPADQTVVGEVETTPASEAEEIIERAAETRRAWCRRPLSRRVQRARMIFYELLEWRSEMLELQVDETGKSKLEARYELWTTCREIGDMLAEADEVLGDDTDGRWWTPGRQMESSWQSRGTVLVVASDYAPVHSTVAPALAAIIAGNAVIVVGDESSPLTAQSVVNIATAIGIPDRLWTGVVGGDDLVDRLADRADAIVSYGSAEQTRRLARRQADRMIPIYGRWKTDDVLIVLNDADIDKAARAAVASSCGGAGRLRRSVRRIYVQESVADSFVDAVVEEIRTLRQSGLGDVDGLDIGPLGDREELHDVAERVDEAASSGARLVAGGRIRPRCRGLFFEPTVLTDVDESMRLWRQGGPGPVVAISTVEAPAEAARRTRDVDGYGVVSIFSGNADVARNMADNVGAPVVGINEAITDLPSVSPPVRGAVDAPLDPIGADRLRALSQRLLTVENRWASIPSILETRTPRRVEQALDAALAAVHRRGWLHKTIDTIVPGR